MCICTHSLVVDHIGCSICLHQTHIGKLYRLATREERGTQDRGLRVHQADQQGAVQPMEDSNT